MFIRIISIYSSLTSIRTIGHILIGISFTCIILGLVLKTINEDMFYISMIVALVVGGFSIIPFLNPKFEKESEIEGSEPKNSLLVSVPTALYAVIAGFAIKNTTEFVSTQFMASKIIHDTSKDYFLRIFDTLWVSPEFKMGLIFLVMAIPFYHGAMIFLSGKSKGGKTGSVVWHFAILFTQSILFLAVSSTLQSLEFVVALFIFLMLVDSIWIVVGQKTKNKPPIGWLSLNLCFTGLLFLSLYGIPNFDSMDLLFLSTMGRTGVDYVGFRHMYGTH